jgi:hypothetical protein
MASIMSQRVGVLTHPVEQVDCAIGRLASPRAERFLLLSAALAESRKIVRS